MPPKTPYWGKRPRDDDDFVRFSDLTPEQKAQRRRAERQERKERERAMSYFLSVQRALEEITRGSGDSSALASIVDGFFVELLKLLRADPTVHLLRNGTVCRVIEAALSNSLLLHSKSLLYVLLGHLSYLVTSPVASYTLEVLVASISLSLSGLADNPSDVEAEMVEGGPGIHTGSGVPSTATLMHSLAEELSDCMGDICVHEVGARALRSIILVLGGYSVRGAPMPRQPMKFHGTLGLLAKAVLQVLEEGFDSDCTTSTAGKLWLAAAQAPTTSFVIQSLLRVCENGTVVDTMVRVRLEGLRHKGQPLLQHLLADPLGCHIVQAYLKVPTPGTVVVAGDAFALRQNPTKKDQLLRTMGIDEEEGEKKESGAVVWTPERLLAGCCWGKTVQLLKSRLSDLLKPGSELVMQVGYVLQDLALYAPTAAHLQILWEDLVQPNLLDYFTISALAPTLVATMRKVAFAGSIATDVGDTASSVPTDINAQLAKDEGQGVRYFAVPVSFQKKLCAELCVTMRTLTAKGAAQHLLVGERFGDRGYDLARVILHLHPSASTMFQHSMDKLKVDDIVALAKHHKGSVVLQQYLRTCSYADAVSRGGGGASSRVKEVATAEARSPVLRLLRRVQPHLLDLTHDKYAAYVVETLYDVAGVEVREVLMKALTPIYESLRDPIHADNSILAEPTSSIIVEKDGEDAGTVPAPQTAESRRHVARKVMAKCCVEQYIHRREDWVKLAKRQCQVQRLMWRMLLDV